MTRLSIVMLSFACLATGCVARAGLGFTTPEPVETGSPLPPPVSDVPTGDAYAPGEDAQWFQADDYLISDHVYDGKPTHFRLAKMMVAEGAEAQFLGADGKQTWTASYLRSRVATVADAHVGALAFCYEGRYSSGFAEGPREKHASRTDRWELAAITDTSDLYKGRVTVGETSCALAAMRVPLQ